MSNTTRSCTSSNLGASIVSYVDRAQEWISVKFPKLEIPREQRRALTIAEGYGGELVHRSAPCPNGKVVIEIRTAAVDGKVFPPLVVAFHSVAGAWAAYRAMGRQMGSQMIQSFEIQAESWETA